MARLNCSACGDVNAEVNDESWRLVRKADDVDVLGFDDGVSSADSADIWADLEVVEARAFEWRDKGVYDPLPPRPEPPNSMVALRCRCGAITRHRRPTSD
ncbi:MAG: hypothetical protein RL391_66 [Actinomycetota bacterium]|jgi:hypothetical protein